MKKCIETLCRNWLSVSLWVTALASMVLMLKTSADPMIEALVGTWLGDVLRPFPTGNQIGFDLSVGLLVSVFFYGLVVALPSRRKRLRIKRHLMRQYDYFKRDCLLQLLWASGGTDSSLVDRLVDRNEFRVYFETPVSDGMDRWHVVANTLQSDPERVARLLEQLEVFRAELEFALTVIDVEDSDMLSFARRLYQALKSGSKWQADYDDVKKISGFFWTIFTGWDIAEGYTERDRVQEFIEGL